MAQRAEELLLDEARQVEGSFPDIGSGTSEKQATAGVCMDVAIIGAGLAGALAALVLARQGRRVTIIDRHAVYPLEFRCEKLSPTQTAIMQELGVLDCLEDVTTQFDEILVVRGGTLTGIQRLRERGLAYSEMVNRVRKAWPSEVTFIEGRVSRIGAGPGLQKITLLDGRAVEARLIVLASGPGSKLHADLGLAQHVIRHAHSISIGFGIAPAGDAPFPFQSMTCFGENAGDRIGYATFFPTPHGMRVNLFSYHSKHEAWIEAFNRDPIGQLRESMPSLVPLLGDFRITMPVAIRPIDLYKTESYRRDGIVLIGDAFQSSCPATGDGVTRLLTDVRQLCMIHLPRWLATPNMEAAKIASFYDDPVKRDCDQRSSREAERGRNLAIETSLRWRAERAALFLASRFQILRKLALFFRGMRLG